MTACTRTAAIGATVCSMLAAWSGSISPAGASDPVPAVATVSASEPVQIDEAWEFTLSGASEVPPNTSMATGHGTVERDSGRIKVTMAWEGLSGPVTGAHLHGPASWGAAAPVLADLVPGAVPEGSQSPIESFFDVTAEQLQMLRDGLVYADVHTALYPGGEIRGQVLKATDEIGDDMVDGEAEEEGEEEDAEDDEGYDDDLSAEEDDEFEDE